MPEIGTLTPLELDRFRMELLKAGFEVGRDGATWTGPLPEALHDLTEARELVIRLHPGWPFRRPSVWVKGLQPSMHLQGDYLCLWDPTNTSYEWLTLQGITGRLEEWAQIYRERPTERDPFQDPHLYWFPMHLDHVLTVDTSSIPFGVGGGSGKRKAAMSDHVIRVGSEGDLKVRWYAKDEVLTPPSDLAMFRQALNTEQARNLDAELEKVGKGGPDILMLLWRSPVGAPNVLALLLERSGDEVTAESVQVGTTDAEVARLRAGRDADELATKQITVFGIGAVGSHVTTLLARSGVRGMTLVDSDRLRPGDMTRHAVMTSVFDGAMKPRAVQSSLFLWREDAVEAVKTVFEHVSDPERIRAIATGSHLVIDAVGEALFTEQLSRVFVGSEIPVLSVALYRGGRVGRSRLVPVGGTAIHEREDPPYPSIPPEAEPEPVQWETGCAAPVNNASPIAVVSAAASAARLAVEVLAGRETSSVDVIDVYEKLDTPGFDQVGTFRHEP